MISLNRFLSLLIGAMAFATTAGLVRYASRYLIESRYLIALFCLAALMLEVAVRPAMGGKRDFIALVLNSSAAIAAIITVKWMMEGIHPWFR